MQFRQQATDTTRDINVRRHKYFVGCGMKNRYGYLIRRAEEKDEPTLLHLLERFVTTQQAARRYDWLYKRNPQGCAATWLACEPELGQIVGFTSIYARDFLVNGKIVKGGVGFDAFVRPDHRRRGIAQSLHVASHQAMANGDVPFDFMCGPPVRANLQALLKAGSQVVGALRYVSVPLNLRGITKMLHLHNYSDSVGQRFAVLDSLLSRVRNLLLGSGDKVAVRVVDRVNYRFDNLWQQIASAFPVIGRRDAAYLDWRYLQNPVCWQQLVALELQGKLIGWAALEFAPQGCLLVDYLLPLDKREAAAALTALINYVASQGACRLTLRFNLKGRYAGLFLRHGFLPGWTKEYFQVLCPGNEMFKRLMNMKDWHIANGDLNPEASPWSVNTAPQAEWTDANYVCASWQESLTTETQS